MPKSFVNPSLLFASGCCVFFVLLSNSLALLPALGGMPRQLLSFLGFYGLETLFVLCGFAFATWMNVSSIQKVERLSFRSLFQFVGFKSYLAYCVVFLFLAVLSTSVATPSGFSWRYLVFLQNGHQAPDIFYPESWAISVAFWSCAFAFLGFGLIHRYVQVSFQTTAKTIFLLLGIAVTSFFRYSFYAEQPAFSLADWDRILCRGVIFRLDAVFYGCLLYLFYEQTKTVLLKMRFLFAIGAGLLFVFLLLGISYFGFTVTQFPQFWAMGYLPFVSISACLILLAIMMFTFSSGYLISKLNYVGRRAYWFYLVHYSLVLALLAPFWSVTQRGGIASVFLWLFSFGLLLLLASLLRRFVRYLASYWPNSNTD